MGDIELLRKMDLFWGMNDEELKLVLKIATRAKYETGQVIFQEGDPCDRLYIVISGLVQISILVTEDIMQVLGEIGSGLQFGEMALIDDAPRSAKAKAIEETVVMEVARDSFLDLIEHHPAFSAKALINLSRTLSRRLRVTNNALRDTMNWNLKIGGVANISLANLTMQPKPVQLYLMNQQKLRGVLLRVDKRDNTYDIMLQDEAGQIFIIPYHAVIYITVDPKAIGSSMPMTLQ